MKWRFVASMNQPRAMFTSTIMPDGQILFGESWPDLREPVALQLFDPKTETWTYPVDANPDKHLVRKLPLLDQEMVPVWSEKLFPVSSFPGPIFLAPDAAAYKSSLRILDAARREKMILNLYNLIPLSDNRFFMEYQSFRQTEVHQAIYKATGDYWQPIDDEGAIGQTATLLPNGKILLVGGAKQVHEEEGFFERIYNSYRDLHRRFYDYAAYKILPACRLYDPNADTWEDLPALKVPRAFHTTTLLPDGRVLVTGGYTEMVDASVKPSPLTATCEMIDLK